MSAPQPGILEPVPRVARFLTFAMAPGHDAEAALPHLLDVVEGDGAVVGLGESFVRAMGRSIDGLGPFPVWSREGVDVPSTPAALWCWLRGDDRGELVHRTRRIERALGGALRLEAVVEAFRYRDGDDLSGYEDGTENPEGDEARAAALVTGRGPGLDGSSFVAVQQWLHDLDVLEAMSPSDQDDVIGRRKSDNEEMEGAPASAHVKRTAQESFEPPAFVLRRSMPWAEARRHGLVFVAFGRSVEAFEALLRRMVGAEDGVQDALFSFTRPVTGAYFWCPPMAGGRLDLSAIGR